MSGYIAVIRYEREAGTHCLASTIETLLTGLAGVARVTCDAVSVTALVWYDRGVVSLAELVRELEGSGVRVTGVAQCKADVGLQPAAIA